MKHNKAVPCDQNKKNIHNLIKTWFNQPARHQRRRLARQAKVAARGTMPINKLKPFVRCPTQKYDHKIRAGKGFTVAELKAAKLTPTLAKTVGITVDLRRKDRNDETTKMNVERLQQYLSKLVIFPGKSGKCVKAVGGIPATSARDSVTGTMVHKICNAAPKVGSIVSA